MRTISTLILAAAIGLPAAAAQEPSTGPGAAEQPKPGQRWARLRIDVDSKGRPLRCRIAETNLYRSTRFWACQGYMKNWRTLRLSDSGRPTTVERMYIVPLGAD
jgi:hypothetical protein